MPKIATESAIEKIKLKARWVKDIIGDDYRNWLPGSYVFIYCQQGTGKTYFILQVLLDYIPKDKRVLILVNRKNLSRQIKTELLRKFGMPVPDDIAELDKIQTIRNVVVESYQFIQNSTLDQAYSKNPNEKIPSSEGFDYIVFEEAHYILTDATFNNLTRIIQEDLIENFHPNAVKLFLSATPEEFNDYVTSAIIKKGGGDKIHYSYTTGKDFSYLNPFYFKDIDDIITTIHNDTSDDKWVIFVSNIEKDGERIYDALGDSACFIKQTTKKDDEDLISIVRDCTFNKKALITTRLLDNGINLKDPKIKHMVVMEWDMVVFLQMIGRRRVDINAADIVNLYIPMRSKRSFCAVLKGLDEKQKQSELFYADYAEFCRRYDTNIKALSTNSALFYIRHDTGKWGINTMASKKLAHDIAMAQRISAAFGTKDSPDNFAFVKEQLAWLGLSDMFDEARLIENVDAIDTVDDIKDYLAGILGQKLFAEEKERLTQLLVAGLNNIRNCIDFRSSRTKVMRAVTIEAIIRTYLGLPYRVLSAQELSRNGGHYKKWYWIINDDAANAEITARTSN